MNCPIDISVVVPVYRSAGILPLLVDRLVKALEPISKSFEIVLVDDASPHDSWNVVSSLQTLFPQYLSTIRL